LHATWPIAASPVPPPATSSSASRNSSRACRRSSPRGPLPDWKVYLRYHLLRAAAPYLAAPFEAEHFRFYSTVLRGTPEMEPRWQRSARVIDGSIGEALGRLYVERYYPPEPRRAWTR